MSVMSARVYDENGHNSSTSDGVIPTKESKCLDVAPRTLSTPAMLTASSVAARKECSRSGESGAYLCHEQSDSDSESLRPGHDWTSTANRICLGGLASPTAYLAYAPISLFFRPTVLCYTVYAWVGSIASC